MADNTTRSITCDSCGEELLVDTPYEHDWGIFVAAMDFGTNSGGMTYDVICDPPISRRHHFCGLVCLSKWVQEKIK